MSPLLFQKPEILKHYGKAYVVEAVKFAGSTEVLAALHAGKLEIGAVSYSNVGAGVVNQGIKDLRIVADGNQGGVDGYASVDFYVRNDSDVRSIADLKGKVLATNGIGGAADFGLRAMLYRSGLQDKRDVTIVAAPFPTLGKLLLEGKVARLAPAALQLRSGRQGRRPQAVLRQGRAGPHPTACHHGDARIPGKQSRSAP